MKTGGSVDRVNRMGSLRRMAVRVALAVTLALSAGIAGLIPATAAAGTAQPIVIEHWQHSSPGRNVVIQQLAEEFNKRNPDVQVKVQIYELGEFVTKITTALATNLGPDTFQVRSGEVRVFQAAGALQPLDEKQITAEQIEQEFVPAPLYHFKHGGKYYALPVDAQTVVLFYNTKVFEEAGLDSRRPPQTWDQVVEYAKKLVKIDAAGQMRIQGAATGGYGPVLATFMIQAGASLWNKEKDLPDFTGPAVEKGFQFALDLVMRHKVEDPGANRWSAFRKDALGMVWAHPAMIGSFRADKPTPEFSVTEAPAAVAGGSRASLMTNWGLVIAKKAPREAATRWIRFVTSPEAQRLYFSYVGELPTRLAVLDQVDVVKDPLYRPVVSSVKVAVPTPWVTTRLWDELLRKAYQLVTQVGQSPASALSWLQEEAVKAELQDRAKAKM
ncbi:MAG TPA: extracellular solute-binding protein [Firmicutes bacterium]|nr:extracellular solute-binding protein [Bacillota bacterium]